MICGIYKILFKSQNIVYIGQSKDIEKRFAEHIKSFNYPESKAKYYRVNMRMYYFFNKYGINDFEFSILEECLESELNDKEKYWLDYYGGYLSNMTFNMQDAGNYKSHIHSEETKLKISKANKGRKKTAEEIQKISQTSKGRKHSEETKLKMSKSKQNNKSRTGMKSSKEKTDKFTETQRSKRRNIYIEVYKELQINTKLNNIELSKKYSINPTAVSLIRNNKHWICDEIKLNKIILEGDAKNE